MLPEEAGSGSDAGPPARPEGRLWGGRFADAPDRAAWALGRSVDFDARLWAEDLEGSRVHAEQLRRIGVLDDPAHDAIVAALDHIGAEFAAGTFAFTATDEDLHGTVERRLIELAGEAGGRLRAGRSRNDQIANDLRRYLARAATELAGDVQQLAAALVDRAADTRHWVAPGYTHLQRAQPVSLAQHLLAHAWAFERDRGRLLDAADRAGAGSTLGSGALAGLTLDLDRSRYAEALGYHGVAPNTMDAVADRDFAVEFLAAASLLGVHLSRLGEEIVLWSSVEFSWARVGDAFSTGSSIMPQKRNPDVAELVRGKAGRLIGDLVALLVTLKGLPLTYNRDLQEDKEPCFDAVDTLSAALPAMAGTVASLRFDRAHLADAATGGFSLATDLAEALVQRGVPFREAHERVGQAVAVLEEEGADLVATAWDRVSALLPELADAGPELLDPEAAVARRRGLGGPAVERVDEQIAALRARWA
jgi:argininosuccinate lyase